MCVYVDDLVVMFDLMLYTNLYNNLLTLDSCEQLN